MGNDNANIIIILTKYLKKLKKADLEEFVGVLCDLEPPRGYSQIQRKHLEVKTPKQMAEFIMKIYTRRFGPGRVRQALKDINENQIRIDLEKELREESKTIKSTVKANPSGRAAKRKRVEEEKRRDNVKPKRGRAKTESKTIKSTVKANPSGRAAKRKRVEEEKRRDNVKPKRGRAKTESKTIKSTVKADTSGRAAKRKRVEEEKRRDNVKPKRGRAKTDEEHFVNQNRNELIKRITNVESVLDDLMEKELLTQEQYDIIVKKETSQAKMRELYSYVRSWGSSEENDTLLAILDTHHHIVIKNLQNKSKAKKK